RRGRRGRSRPHGGRGSASASGCVRAAGRVPWEAQPAARCECLREPGLLEEEPAAGERLGVALELARHGLDVVLRVPPPVEGLLHRVALDLLVEALPLRWVARLARLD